MTVIVVDTNIIADCPRLDNATWTSLVAHAGDWGVRIVVPEVVFMESVNVVRRRWRQDRDRLATLRLGHFRLTDTQASMVAAIDRESDEYAEWLKARLNDLGIEIQPLPPVDPMEIARRASDGRTPFTRSRDGKTKDGYRDTLIWLTLLKVAADNPNDEVWLVSENHTDFGPTPPDWTGTGIGKREDCPIRFDDDLFEDLAAQDMSDRVHYVVRADLLEQHLASQFAPINDADLKALVASINMTALGSSLMYATLGRNVEPAAAALPAGTAAGQIVLVHEQQDGWEFSEAARRGGAGWTARFVVDTTVGIELVGAPWLDSEITKMLRLTGQVALSSNGEIVEITVDSAEALPDDPDRVRHSQQSPLSGIALPPTLSTELVKNAMVGLGGTNVSELLAQQNAELMKDINNRIGPSVTEMLKDRHTDLMKDIASRFNGPNVAEMLAERNAELMKDINDRLSGGSVAEMLAERNAELMKDINNRVFGFAKDPELRTKQTESGTAPGDSTTSSSELDEDEPPLN